MNSNEIKSALEWRYATKKMDPTKKISAHDWQLLKDSLRLSPSSYGLQPWKFIVVQNPELRKKLREVSWGQSQIEDASHLVVFTTKRVMDEKHIKAHIDRTAEVRGLAPEALDGYYQFMLQKITKEKSQETHLGWNQRQAYIAMGFLLQTAALLKIDAVPMEGLDPEKYDEILGLKGTEYTTVAAVPLGYRHAEDSYQQMVKARFDEKNIFDIRD